MNEKKNKQKTKRIKYYILVSVKTDLFKFMFHESITIRKRVQKLRQSNRLLAWVLKRLILFKM